MTGSDDRIPPEGGRAQNDSRRSRIRRAEEVPVTDAMLTPRSEPGGPRPTTDAREEPRFCPQCGRKWTPESPVCRSCRYRARESKSSTTAGSRLGRLASGPGSLRRLVLIAVVLAALVLGFRTLTDRDPVVEEPAPAVDTTSLQSDLADLEFYAEDVSLLALDVADAMATGRLINDGWESGSLDYDSARQQMRDLVTQVSIFPARLGRATPPPDVGSRLHQSLLGSLNGFLTAAETMLEGLESTDTGETRRGGLLAFEAAGFEFGLLSDQVATAVEEMLSAPVAAGDGVEQ